MKKEELKNILEKEFSKITVNEQLKEKTLVNIKKRKNVSYLPYLKNVCAIFIVSLICFCVFYTKNQEFNNIENISNESKTENNLNIKSTNPENFTEFKLNKSIRKVDEDMIYNISLEESFDAMKSPSKSLVEDYGSYSNSIEFGNYLLTEDEFLINYPNAIKKDKGYIVKEGNSEKIYVFENGKLKETIIINN